MDLPAGAFQKASQWLTTSVVMQACSPSRPHSSSSSYNMAMASWIIQISSAMVRPWLIAAGISTT